MYYGTHCTLTGQCLVVTVPASLYELLRSLESRLSRVIKSVGRVAHGVWRSFNTDIKTEPAEGFVDGDLVEAFLDLDRETQHHAIQGIQMDDGGGMMRDATVDDIVKIVEDLTRIH
ncbi:CPSF A subunit region domain-containing protein [Phthorimaea operculella]|nr:CPSF A subunit region domain-containing protein [Phthorimaea operculella]